MNESTKRHPVEELNRRLIMAKGPKAELAAYMHYLPEIVPENPAEAIAFAGGAESTATELKDWPALVEIIHHRARARWWARFALPTLQDCALD